MENEKVFNFDSYEGKKIEDVSVEEIKLFFVAVQKETSNAMKLAENTMNESTEFKKYCDDVLKNLIRLRSQNNE